jgi:hypothetical protein
VRAHWTWKADGTGPKVSDRSVVSITSSANDEFESTQAYHALDCEIFLDGKRANLV